jgi:eukaryotic-like serine/threonine-protein kinase
LELGRYRLDEQVGQGGMAVVWRGWDTQLRRTVAVKVLHAHLHAREEIRKRFDREAHAVARLHHPYILDVYDFSGPQADPSYLVTEFIRGQTLRTFAETHPFDPPELAAACLLPIAEALQHAHAAGVVHRDLKPENIMVREDGVVKLTDFGIAALLDPDEKFTITGSILGSPAHLAPETIEGKPVDPRADLFSFGTILYWLSCGKLPYQGTSPAALLRSILDGKREDPRTVRPSVADAQAKIIARCLENDPARRYQSAAEVKLELTQLLRDAGIEEPVRELAAFVRAPEAHAANVRARLVSRNLAAGEEHLLHKRTSAALAAFGRALALDPQNAQARGRVERIRRRDRLLKVLRGAVVGLVLAAVVIAVMWQLHRAQEREAARVAAERAAQEKVAAQQKKVAEQDAREAAEREAQPGPAAPGVAPASPRPVEPAAPSSTRKRTAPPPSKPPLAPINVKLHFRYGAHVIVDGRDLGDNNLFSLPLSPGTHRVVVQHPCCEDSNQLLVVNRNRPDQMYKPDYGRPKPARFRVLNAPPDARILVDGVLIGTASDPGTYGLMPGPTTKQPVAVTIGDRSLSVTLKAGDCPRCINVLDYSKAIP